MTKESYNFGVDTEAKRLYTETSGMTGKQLNVTETPIEELECDKKYVFDTGIIFECGNGFRSEILGEDVVRLLNEQDEKNIELSTKCSQLKKENEQLKSRCNNYDKALKALQDLTDKKIKENEQLKQKLKIYRKVASCGNCHYHNYDWFDDGDEFEVCDKGNDVSEGICEEWEEL